MAYCKYIGVSASWHGTPGGGDEYLFNVCHLTAPTELTPEGTRIVELVDRVAVLATLHCYSSSVVVGCRQVELSHLQSSRAYYIYKCLRLCSVRRVAPNKCTINCNFICRIP